MPLFHWCLRCREMKPMTKISFHLTKQGAPRLSGQCIDCGCKMSRMLPKTAGMDGLKLKTS